jgi:hypothetical protein
MPAYYFLHDADFFANELTPVLAASWREQSLDPCRTLCRNLLPAVESFRSESWTSGQEPLVRLVAEGLRFDRLYWNQLAGEIILFGAREIPEVYSDMESLCELVECGAAGQTPRSRDLFRPIEQAHWGSRDLAFGRKVYRPEHAGLNLVSDVHRLAEYLDQTDPTRWAVRTGAADAAEWEDMCASARQSLAELQSLYERARTRGQLIIHETL